MMMLTEPTSEAMTALAPIDIMVETWAWMSTYELREMYEHLRADCPLHTKLDKRSTERVGDTLTVPSVDEHVARVAQRR